MTPRLDFLKVRFRLLLVRWAVGKRDLRRSLCECPLRLPRSPSRLVTSLLWGVLVNFLHLVWFSFCLRLFWDRETSTSSPGLFPQKIGGAGKGFSLSTHFLREKPWGRGWWDIGVRNFVPRDRILIYRTWTISDQVVFSLNSFSVISSRVPCYMTYIAVAFVGT